MTEIALVMWLRAQGPRRMAHGLTPCAFDLFNYHPTLITKALAQTWQARVGFRDTGTSIFTNQEHMPV